MTNFDKPLFYDIENFRISSSTRMMPEIQIIMTITFERGMLQFYIMELRKIEIENLTKTNFVTKARIF